MKIKTGYTNQKHKGAGFIDFIHQIFETIIDSTDDTNDNFKHIWEGLGLDNDQQDIMYENMLDIINEEHNKNDNKIELLFKQIEEICEAETKVLEKYSLIQH